MRRKHRRLQSEPDLDITPFMNLMIVLVPVLLLNMVFAHTSVLELNFPTGESLTPDQAEELQIQVVIHSDRLVVADNQGGVIKAIAQNDGEYDFVALKDVMKEIKSRVPDKKDIIIMPSQETSYQALVSVMDTVRSYDAVVAGNLVEAELFPEISLGDAPTVEAGEALKEGGQS
ncbi:MULTISPECIES: biopolymer transporter ExbD [unclassified Marinobacter]|uniref:ExbD/TolR family protein n=1 Tax=unclassified Marinobacter TaxID=83889 RepID=UPI0026E19DED|nr:MULTISPECIES: biopolymer transporter ExbD [unclassified Marinobacter]MDO6440620.1 biopolymer transporter ExbD [Marinobacter sp. 2_MG-2023]MDO6823448.1 biopolymer transporter ExbD [Marinobacter sp. 1_MG-2023]